LGRLREWLLIWTCAKKPAAISFRTPLPRIGHDLRLAVFLEEVVEGLPEKGLHGGSALDGKPAELPGHFGRQMSGHLLGARSSGFGARTRRPAPRGKRLQLLVSFLVARGSINPGGFMGREVSGIGIASRI